MNEETKEKAKDVTKALMHGAAEWLKEEAKSSTGVMRWVYGILFILAAGALTVFFSSCNGVPRVQLTVEQVQAAETIFTTLGGEVKYRVVPVENIEK